MKIKKWVILFICVFVSKIASAEQSPQLSNFGVFVLASLSFILVISSLILLVLKIVILKQFRIDKRWVAFNASAARREIIFGDLTIFEKITRSSYILFVRLNSVVLFFMIAGFLLFIFGVN